MNLAIPFPSHLAPRSLPPIAKTLPAAIEKIVREINPEKIVLFGSYA